MRGKNLFLIGAFAVIISGVGLTQALVEARRGERPQFTDLFLHAPSEEHLRGFEEDLEDASCFTEYLRPAMQYAQFAALGNTGDYALMGRDGWLFYKNGVQFLIEPWDGNAAVADVIVSFRERLAGRGIELLVVPAPGKASVYPDRLTARARAGGGVVYAHSRQLMGQLKARGVAMVDLFEVFDRARAEEGDEPDLYLQRDTHWSPAGMRLAAEAVAARLIELGWVARGDAAYDLRPASIERRGDIVHMMRSPRIEARFERQRVDCAQVVTKGEGLLYADDPQSEVLVLGDSFLRIYQADEPESAGFIAHLARELGMSLASIVNDGGASTLVRQELARKPELLSGKKVVVWEFVERDIRFGAEGWQDVALPELPAAETGAQSAS
ncbi:MAG: hypothetical protein GWP08_04735 [Nitrospiraceae bacterium]|nr:hypothetical protein [Nitrospiraceae bacterium]